MPAPKFATAADPDAPTLGGRRSRFAAGMLGQPFMPHQQLVADVTGELIPTDDPRGWTLPDRPGFWVPRYKLCVITEQRRAGKTHQLVSDAGERCFATPGFSSRYTAQTGTDARNGFFKFEEKNIRGTLLDRFVHLKKSNGSEALEFPNLSKIRPHPPTETKGHGDETDREDIDEAWAFSEAEGKALMQAIGPTQLTIPTAQTYIWSAGGTEASTWLAGLVARGREGDPAIAYFEWAIPDDADAEDFDVILEHHPAAGRTISRESLVALHDTSFADDPAGWARAAGNRWTEVIGGAIGLEDWKRLRYADPIPDRVPVGYGAARAADGSQVVIAAAALVEGVVVIEIVAVVAGSYGAVDQVRAIATDGPIAIATSGPSAGLARRVAKLRRVKLIPASDGDYSGACADLLDAIEPKAYRFREHPDLDAAVKVAATRKLGDGGLVWSRTAAGSPIAALEAATLAAHALSQRPASKGRKRIVTASAA
jgi:hypothetical protein